MTDRSINRLTAEILSTGDELRTGAVVDTNSAAIAREFELLGIRVARHICIGDDPEAITGALVTMSGRSDFVIVTGGLGPTVDDRTAEAAASAAGVGLIESPEALDQIAAYFHARNLEVSPANRKQALVPEGAHILENPVGTAPGFHMTRDKCRLFFLPGVPREMKTMLKEQVVPAISQMSGLQSRGRGVRVISTFGFPESVLGERVQTVERQFPGICLGLRVRFPEIDIRLYPDPARSDDDPAAMDDAVEWIASELGHRVVSRAGLSMPAAVGRLLTEKQATLAVAESCTGGLIAAMLTDIPGSSAYFRFSGVTYANDAKIRVLGVSPQTLERWGAVHERTAREMAEGARRIADTDYGISTTGIAGPDGGTADKPVGTVCIGIASRKGAESTRYGFHFGNRELNRRMFAITALNRLRRELLGAL